ncbi:MAG: choice-of-anchor Q domain-containing protein [Solirubrobacterales bacterium]
MRAARLPLMLVAIAGTLALSGGSAAAAGDTYAPNKTGDHAPNGCTSRDCTLREAVIAANAHPGRDTILLARTTYDLSIPRTGEGDPNSGDLDVSDPVVIKHKGKGRAVIDANHIDRVLHIVTSNTDRYTDLVKVVVRGGKTTLWGGGIMVGNGIIGLTNSVVMNNRAAYEGGGIFASAPAGELELVTTTVKANRADQDGGGVASHVETKIRASTISGNTVTYNNPYAGGGGIYFNAVDAQLRLSNDTIANNRVEGSGGGILTYGTGRLNNLTVARNVADTDNDGTGLGGGIAGGMLKVGNSIVALNKYGNGNVSDCSGAYDSFGRNFLTNNSVGCSGFPDPPNIVTGDPRLGTLANNGGPTQTIALRRHSPAINHAVKSSAETRDQRGDSRGRKPDIGAFER